MDTTRNFFVVEPISGTETTETSENLLSQLQFKGVTVLSSPTPNEVNKVFENNKSVVCMSNHSNLSKELSLNALNAPNAPIRVPLDLSSNIPEQFQAIAAEHHCDIGDHISNSSGLNGTPSQKDCAYCSHLVIPQEDNIYLGEDFFIFPTLGQFINGYLLIIPYEHVMSIAELDLICRKEFLEVLADARYLLNLAYGCKSPLVWENGTGNGGKGKAKDSVVHAHVHVAPTRLNLQSIQKISGFPMEHTSMEELSAYGRHSYLLIQGDTDSDWGINDNPALYIPRQYVRQLIAEDEGIPGDNWNWRTHGFLDRRHQTNLAIYQALLKNWSQLPERIKRCTDHFVSTFQA